MKLPENTYSVTEAIDSSHRKRKTHTKKPVPITFDKEGLLLSWGIAIAFIVIGVLIIWATYTAPEGATNSSGFTVAQRLARVLPRNWQENIAFILGALMALFGVFCFFLGLKTIFRFVVGKMKERNTDDAD